MKATKDTKNLLQPLATCHAVAFAKAAAKREKSGEHRLPVRQSDGLVPWRACPFRQLAEKNFAGSRRRMWASSSPKPCVAQRRTLQICAAMLFLEMRRVSQFLILLVLAAIGCE